MTHPGGGFIGFGRTPLRPDLGVVAENAQTGCKSSPREIFTEIVHNLIWQHEHTGYDSALFNLEN